MMCAARSVLIKSIIDASDVDLPCPVGPVTRIRPRGSLHRSFSTIGIFSSSMAGMVSGMTREATPTDPRCRYTFTRNRPSPVTAYERSSSQFFSNFCF